MAKGKCENAILYNCENCKLPDCTYDGILKHEKMEISQRDSNYLSSIKIIKPKPTRASMRRGMTYT